MNFEGTRDKDQDHHRQYLFDCIERKVTLRRGLFALLSVAILVLAAFTVMFYELPADTAAEGPDSDADGLSDSQEINSYFLFEKVETEDCIEWNSVDHYQFHTTLNADDTDDAYLFMKFTDDNVPPSYPTFDPLPWDDYQINMTGWGSIQLNGYSDETLKEIERDENILLNSVNITLWDGATQVDPSGAESELREWRYEFTEEGVPEGILIIRFWSITWNFTLTMGDNHPDRIKFCVSRYPWSGDLQNTYPNLLVDYINLTSSMATIYRKGLDPNNDDVDGDLILDGTEIVAGSSPWKADLDRDGLNDTDESVHGTSPNDRDSDFDGLRDRVELQYTSGSPPAPYTPYDSTGSWSSVFERKGRSLNPDYEPAFNTRNNWVSNQGIDTDPTDWDTDDDGMPDGCIDGLNYTYLTDSWFVSKGENRVHDFYEGEDLDLDGVVDGGDWDYGTGTAETNPDDADTDNDDMNDGWEIWFILNPLDGTNNGFNGSAGDVDHFSYAQEFSHPVDYDDDPIFPLYTGDGLSNLDEFIAGTNPRMNDTDQDMVNDWRELNCTIGDTTYGVILRTNVTRGARTAEYYGTVHDSGGYEWIWYNGTEYGYAGNDTVNITGLDHPLEGYELDGFQYIDFFDEQSWIMLNYTNSTLYVCRVISEPGTGNRLQRVYYNTSESESEAPSSTVPEVGYRNKEMYWTDPLKKHSDGIFMGTYLDTTNSINDYLDGYLLDTDEDGLCDAREIDADNDTIQDPVEFFYCSEAYPWDHDTDGDGVRNSRDTDSDADGLSDEYEVKMSQWQRGNYIYSPTPYFLSPYDPDSDGDGLLDGENITVGTTDYRYTFFRSLERPIANETQGAQCTFVGEVSAGTNNSNPDTDGDLLSDGYNVSGKYGISHIGEWNVGTNNTDNDTDDDTLLDGWEYIGWSYTVRDPDGRLGTMLGTSNPLTPTGSNADSDGDGIPDRLEYGRTNGNDTDSDGDGLEDDKEDINKDGFYNRSLGETNPVDMDTDRDGLLDGGYDYDGDSTIEYWEGEDVDNDAYNDTLETNATLWDTDGDGVEDGLERRIVVFRTWSPNGTYKQYQWIAIFITNYACNSSGLLAFKAKDVSYSTGIDTGQYQVYQLAGDDAYDPWGNEIRIDYDLDYTSCADGSGYLYIKHPTEAGKYMRFCRWTNPTSWYNGSFYPLWEFRDREVYFTGISDPTDDSDTDGDGITDYEEFNILCRVRTHGPRYLDVDGDGYFSPSDSDSDGDGINDQEDPNGEDDEWFLDPDADGLGCALDVDSDGDEDPDDQDPSPLVSSTDPNDDDNDGIPNGVESTYQTSYDDNDTDDDGILDGYEGAWWEDIDGDGLINALDPDSDGDGLLDGANRTLIKPTDDDLITNFTEEMDILFEKNGNVYIIYGEDQNNNILDPLENETDPYYYDTDNDRLPDGKNMTIEGETVLGEYYAGTDRLVQDTDGDGFVDGGEVLEYFPYDEILPLYQDPQGFYPMDVPENQWVWNVVGQEFPWQPEHRIDFIVEEAGEYLLEFETMTSTTVNDEIIKANLYEYEWMKPEETSYVKYQLASYSRKTYRLGGSCDEMDCYPYRQNLPAHWMYENNPMGGYSFVHEIEFTVSEDMKSCYIIFNVTGDEEHNFWVLGTIKLKKKGLDPLNIDTDCDGFHDYNETWSSGYFKSYPTVRDSDRDGLSDGQEVEMELSPAYYDSDHDGVGDKIDMQPKNYWSNLVWKDTYDPGLAVMDKNISIFWAHNMWGGWDSPVGCEEDFASRTIEQLSEAGFTLKDAQLNHSAEDHWSDWTWSNPNRDVDAYTYNYTKVVYAVMNDTRNGTLVNFEPVDAPFWNTAFDIRAVNGSAQEVLFQFSLKNTADKGDVWEEKDEWTLVLFYSVWQELKKDTRNHRNNYIYFGEEPLMKGLSICEVKDRCSVRTNRNAFETRLQIPAEKALPKDTDAGENGTLHVRVEIAWLNSSAGNNMTDPDSYVKLNASSADVRISALFVTGVSADVSVLGRSDVTEDDLGLVIEALWDVPGNVTNKPSGPDTLVVDGSPVKIIYLNELKDDIQAWHKRDAGLKVYGTGPNDPNPTTLDYVVVISQDNTHFRNLTMEIDWSNEDFNWSDYWNDEDDLPNDPEDKDNTWVATDYISFAKRTYKFMGKIYDFGTTYNPVKEKREAIQKLGALKDFLTGADEPSLTARGERIFYDNDEIFSVRGYASPVAGYSYGYYSIEVVPPSPNYGEMTEVFYYEEVTYHVDYEEIDDVPIFKDDSAKWKPVVDKVTGVATGLLSVYKSGKEAYVMYDNGQYMMCAVHMASTASEVMHFAMDMDELFCLADNQLAILKKSKFVKGFDKVVAAGEAIVYGYKAWDAYDEDDLFNSSIYFEKCAIATIDFVIGCIPVIGWIYQAINAAVLVVTWALAKAGIIEKEYSLTELVYKAAVWLSPWTPTYIATYALSALYDDIGDEIDKITEADPNAIVVFIHPIAEEGEKPKARPGMGEVIGWDD